jgi:PAS domain S-box-containing protein
MNQGLDILEPEVARALLDATEDMVFIKRADTLAFVHFNAAGERLLGWSLDELRGKTDHDFYPRAQADFFHARDREALAHDGVTEVAAERIDTRHGPRWLRTRKVAIRVDGEARFLLGISRDVTDEVIRDIEPRAVEPTAVESADAGPRAVRSLVGLVARDGRVPVLLLGETGVGKGHFARLIHDQSPRAAAPFVIVNAALLSRELAASTLFGHERGAFTGADRRQIGVVELAHGGTLFLDEVAELPLDVQAQLLSYLDSGRFRRLGGGMDLSADVRLLAATNANLDTAVASGRFRGDLLHRLRVIPIVVPPLRERLDELPALARRLVADLARVRGRPAPDLDAVDDALARYPWPGNVRELKNVLERAIIVADGAALQAHHLWLTPGPSTPPHSVGSRAPSTAPSNDAAIDSDAHARAAHIRAVLDACDGNKSEAARRLGMTRVTLRRWLKRP